MTFRFSFITLTCLVNTVRVLYKKNLFFFPLFSLTLSTGAV